MPEIVEKSTIKNPAFWVCLGTSIALLVAGFLTPFFMAMVTTSSVAKPNSTPVAVSTEPSIFAMKKGVDARVRHGKTEVTVGDLDKKGEQEMRITSDNELDIE